MKLARFDEVPVVDPVARGFRGGDIRFRDLLQGTEGHADNYGLQWVEVDDAFHTPRHRHNFEQVRILMEGRFGFGPDQVQEAGSIGYFCEATAYTQDAQGPSATLLLQVGGPSRQGFMSRRQLRSGVDELKKKGSFDNGVFTWYDAQGKKHNQDSYEATWEHVHGRPVLYPRPQFAGPVLMYPERFAWHAQPGREGVFMRRMARFHGHGLEIAQLRLEAGAQHLVDAREQAWLLFCSGGRGQVQGRDYLERTSIECSLGERIVFRAEANSEFWLLGLPVFASTGADSRVVSPSEAATA